MFRLIKLKPLHGWNAVAWELGIVTLGVLIALAAQQWAGDRSRHDQTVMSMAAVKEELQEHYGYAVEYRVVYPCLNGQIARLRDRLLKSGATLDPAPLFQEGTFHFVLRQPSKIYPTDAWEAAINDGTTQRLDPAVRRALAGHYGQLPDVRDLNRENNATEEALAALAQPLPLDASVRYSILRDLEQQRGRMEYMDYLNGQIIDYIKTVGMVPSAETARAVVERYGTYSFCKAHGYPTRSLKEAMVGVPS